MGTSSASKYFVISITVAISSVASAQSPGGTESKIPGIGAMTGISTHSDNYNSVFISLNKRRHRFFTGPGYSFNTKNNSKVYSWVFGYKNYFKTGSGKFGGFIHGGIKIFYNTDFIRVTNCDTLPEDVRYETGGGIIYWGLGVQQIIKEKFLLGLSYQLGYGHGLGNKKYGYYYIWKDAELLSQNIHQPYGCLWTGLSNEKTKGFYEFILLLSLEYRFKTG